MYFKVPILLFLILLFNSCENKEHSFYVKYGMEYNINRERCHLLRVSANMKLEEDIPDKRYLFTIQSPSGELSSFKWKELLLDSGKKLLKESDFYYNSKTKEWLIATFEENGNECKYIHQEYFEVNTEFSNRSLSNELSKPQFDSTLNSWNSSF